MLTMNDGMIRFNRINITMCLIMYRSFPCTSKEDVGLTNVRATFPYFNIPIGHVTNVNKSTTSVDDRMTNENARSVSHRGRHVGTM